jgi:hypothetical protein
MTPNDAWMPSRVGLLRALEGIHAEVEAAQAAHDATHEGAATAVATDSSACRHIEARIGTRSFGWA